jgi:hypothetical protein
MENLSDERAQLAPLQTFNPRAFVGDDNAPQELCNFILTLTLIYNDCKNGIFSNLLLTNLKPTGIPEPSQDWGTYGGMKVHLLRLHFALIHELLRLVLNNEKTIKHPFFLSVIKLLPKRVKESWTAIVAASLEKQTTSSLNKALLMIRNKVSFHYDPKELYRGYRYHFFQNSKPTELAYVSRGSSMKYSRLYFADAAAEGYLLSQIEGKDAGELLNRLADITGDVNQAIMQIVDRFIQKRGYAYKDFKTS